MKEFELMEEGLRRELLEETGLCLHSARLAGICEDVITGEALQLRYPDSDSAHKLYFLFFCEVYRGTPLPPLRSTPGKQNSFG